MTVPEFADKLGISQMTVWRWLKKGKIVGRRIGDHKVDIDPSQLKVVVRPYRRKGADLPPALAQVAFDACTDPPPDTVVLVSEADPIPEFVEPIPDQEPGEASPPSEGVTYPQEPAPASVAPAPPIDAVSLPPVPPALPLDTLPAFSALCRFYGLEPSRAKADLQPLAPEGGSTTALIAWMRPAIEAYARERGKA